MWVLLIICSSVLVALAASYVAVRMIRPTRFALRAEIARVLSISLEMHVPVEAHTDDLHDGIAPESHVDPRTPP